MLDSKLMYDHLVGGNATQDSFIQARTGFVKQLIAQRKLDVRYELIEHGKNIATKLLSA